MTILLSCSRRAAAVSSRRFVSTTTPTAAAAPLNPARVQLADGSQRQHRHPLDALAARRVLDEDEEIRSDLAYCLSFAGDDSDFARNFSQLFPNDRMKEQLRVSKNQLRHRHTPLEPQTPLPRTLADALHPSERRAIVVTEAKAPFGIHFVNTPWEGLCGYSLHESQNRTLGSLLQGGETDILAATGLITSLLRGQDEAGTTLTNYTKSGRRFRNRIRVGPLYDSTGGNAEYFVGVLQEVHDGM